jgi:hypothetical protein
MRKRLLFQTALLVALALFSVACRNAKPETTADGLRAGETESVEDSGRHLAGDYVVESLADDYTASPVQGGPRWTFSFKEDGAFRSERNLRGVMRVEEGHYLISASRELVLYVESVAGEALTDARFEHYRIEAESDADLRLRRDGATAFVLHKK